MKANIYFIRHAECESNVDPHFDGAIDGLTEKGIHQSKTVAKYFKNRNISDIFSSDIVRAKLTAQEISNVINREINILEFTKERSITNKGSAVLNYKEDSDSFKGRLSQTKDFLENLPEGNFVFVSHAIFLKALISLLLLQDFFTEELSNQISDQLIIDNVSISKFIYNIEKNKWKVDYINKKLA